MTYYIRKHIGNHLTNQWRFDEYGNAEYLSISQGFWSRSKCEEYEFRNEVFDKVTEEEYFLMQL